MINRGISKPKDLCHMCLRKIKLFSSVHNVQQIKHFLYLPSVFCFRTTYTYIILFYYRNVKFFLSILELLFISILETYII